MFVLIIEQRVSSEIKKMGDPANDWYALMACALPFAPTKGLELQSKPGALFSTIELQEVIYNPSDGTFWAESLPILRPKPDAKTVAEKLVTQDDWDAAVEEPALEETKTILREKAVKKLQRVIMRVQPSVMQGPINLAFDPRGKGKRH